MPPVQSLMPVLVMRSVPALASVTIGVAITRTQSAIDSVPRPASQTPADSRYAAFAKLSPEKVLKGTLAAVTPPQAVVGDGPTAVAIPVAAVVKAR